MATLFAVEHVGSSSFDDLCRNDQVAEYRSPGGKRKVIVFQRDCGATTGFSTQASLLPVAEEPANVSGNLFVADTNHDAAPAASWGGPDLGVRWVNSGLLVLEHDPRARIYKAEADLEGVRVRYNGPR